MPFNSAQSMQPGFLNLRVKIPLLPILFSKKILSEENFPTGGNLKCAVAPHLYDVTADYYSCYITLRSASGTIL